MNSYWFAATVVGAALMVGCGDRAPENTQNYEETAPAVPADTTETAIEPPAEHVAEAPAVSPRRDDSTARDRSVAATPRATTGARRAPADRPAAAPSSRAESRDETPTRAAAPAPAAPRFREITVAAGTALPLDLITPVSSATATVEMPVRARLRQAVVVDGYTAIPAGAVLHGHVTDVDRAGRVRGRSRLALRFSEVELRGTREALRTDPLTFEGEASKGEDATKIGGGAVGGAIVGGIIGGAEGAAKGAAIGGAAGTGVVLATRGREVTLGAGANLAASLATPFTVEAPVR